MMIHNYLNHRLLDLRNLFVFIFSISCLFLSLSCSDDLQIEPASSDLTVDNNKNEEPEANVVDNEDNNYIQQKNIESLDEAIDVLAVSEEEKCYLKNFINSIKEQLNLDDFTIMDALSKGKEALEELGINNEDVIQFLFTLCFSSFLPSSEALMFLDILKSLNLDSDNGNLDANKISSLLFSDNFRTFVEEHFLTDDQKPIIKKITEFLSKISSKI